MLLLHGTMLWMGVAKKNGNRFYDFVNSEVHCLFYKNRSVEISTTAPIYAKTHV
jgi:hypothetical protein